MSKTPAVLLVLFCSTVAAQDGIELLKRAVAASKAIKTFETEELLSTETTSGKLNDLRENRTHVHVKAAAGDKVHSVQNGIVSISDGLQSWEFNPDNREYTHKPKRTAWSGLLNQFAWHVEHQSDARVVRQEPLQLSTGAVMCTVVEAIEQNSKVRRVVATWWIDAQRNIPLKLQTVWTFPDNPDFRSVQVFAIEKVTLDPAFPESLFSFSPPEGAKKVAELSYVSKHPLLGKKTAYFELKAGSVPLMLRGNVTVLRFAWVEAEKDEFLPFLELLHRDSSLRQQGLRVYTIGPLPAHAPGRNWAKELTGAGYTLPAISDPESAARRALEIQDPAIVVLDRDGTILHIENGGNRQTEVLKALRKVLTW